MGIDHGWCMAHGGVHRGEAGAMTALHSKLPNGPAAKIVTITPAMAKEWLATSRGNRSINESQIARMVEDMKNRHWHLNGEPIIIDNAGCMMDGHHRLTACIKANESFTSWAIFGIDPATYVSIDTGAMRGPGAVLEVDNLLAGRGKLTNVRLLAATCRWMALYENTKGSMSMLKKYVFGNDMILDVMKRHPDLKRYVDYVVAHDALKRLSIPSISAWTFYLFSKQDSDLAQLFYEALEHGVGLKGNEPVYLLRERLIQMRADKTRTLKAEIIAGLTFRAWIYTRDNRPTKLLRWNPEIEDFPRL